MADSNGSVVRYETRDLKQRAVGSEEGALKRCEWGSRKEEMVLGSVVMRTGKSITLHRSAHFHGLEYKQDPSRLDSPWHLGRRSDRCQRERQSVRNCGL